MSKKATPAKQPKERSKKWMIEPYHYPLTVVLTDDLVASRLRRNRTLGHCTAADISAFDALHTYSGHRSCIFLPFRPDAGLVVHEVWHCVYYLMDSIGAELENEVVAYLLGWLVREVALFTNAVGDGGKARK